MKQTILDMEKKNYKIEIQMQWYSETDCLSFPNKLYIFGDNARRYGTGGQAQIRRLTNSTGLATKFKPSMDPESFFNDAQYDLCCNIIDQDVEKIKLRIQKGSFDTLVFPKDGLGTGLSQLNIRAPKVFDYLCHKLQIEFGVKTDKINKGILYV